MSNELIAGLCEGAEVHVTKHKEAVFQFGSMALYFGIVLTGAYKLSRISPGGEESVFYFVTPGDVVAALVMSQKNPVYPVTVRAMGPSRMLLVPQTSYLRQWIKNPELLIQIQSLLSIRMNSFQNQKVMQRAPLSAKVASLLLQLVAQDTSQTELEVPLPLTRKEIADSLGATVESVIRVMSEWAKLGYIATSEQHIKILKPEMIIRQIEQIE